MKLLKSKTLNSAIWYTVSNVLAKAITLLITPVFARILTKTEYGEYTNFVSWQNILITIFSLELSSTVLRARFDRDTDSSFNSYVFSVSWFSIIVTSVLSLILIIANTNQFVKRIIGIDQAVMLMLSAILIFSPILQIYQAQQRAEIKYKISSIITIAYGIMSFIIPIVIASVWQNKLFALLLGIAINSIIWGGVLIVYLSTKKDLKFKSEDIKYALIFALPIVPHLVSSIIMGNSDKIMIKNMCGSESAAVYGLVYTCALAVTLLRNSLNNAWLPWFYNKMKDKNYNTIRSVSNIYIIIFSFGSLLICLLGPELVVILGGTQYKDALMLVPIIMLGCYYNFLYLFYVNIEFYEKKTSMISVVTVITAVLNLCLNYVFISKFGYSAAAYTTAFCNICIVLFHYIVTRKMDNKDICNNKLIFSSAIISFVSVYICIYAYKVFLLRITIILILFVGMLALVFKVKKKGLLTL